MFVANFALPIEGNLFDVVQYGELDKEEATQTVETYNKEGKSAMPPQDKRMRSDRYGNRRDNYRSGSGK